MPCRESAREEEYRSKQVNQGFALVWSVWRLALLPPPFPPFSSIFLSPLAQSLFLLIILLSLPGSPPSAHLPACCLQTQLISVCRLVVLPALWNLLLLLPPPPETERTWDTHVAACQPVCVFWITGVFIHHLCVCVWMPESRDPVSSYRDNHWTCFKYLLNHTSPAFTYKCTQIDFPIQYAVLLWHAKVVRVSLRVRACVCVWANL